MWLTTGNKPWKGKPWVREHDCMFLSSLGWEWQGFTVQVRIIPALWPRAGFLPSLWECGSYIIFFCQACFPFLVVIIELSFPVEAFFIAFCWVWPHLSTTERGMWPILMRALCLGDWFRKGAMEPCQKIWSLPQNFTSRAVRERASFLSARLPALRMMLSWISLVILHTHEGSLSEEKANTEGSRAEK